RILAGPLAWAAATGSSPLRLTGRRLGAGTRAAAAPAGHAPAGVLVGGLGGRGRRGGGGGRLRGGVVGRMAPDRGETDEDHEREEKSHGPQYPTAADASQGGPQLRTSSREGWFPRVRVDRPSPSTRSCPGASHRAMEPAGRTFPTTSRASTIRSSMPTRT